MDTIFALSSGQPPAAIALVRISGPRAVEALQRLSGKLPEPRRATVADLRGEDGDLLDQALVLRFEAPATATGEELVELHLHGGRAVVSSVLSALGKMRGLRPAEPGEFTRRAFANGRIDLTEAEGLADLLAAETDSQRRSALRMAGGALTRKADQWRIRILALAAAVEAQLDFSDESDVESALPSSWEAERQRVIEEIQALLDQPSAERLREGVRVVIAGPPNSGKSTLLNALAGWEAAITSEVAGTTRDLIEVPLAIGGVPTLLIDSAGIRSSDDQVESIGIRRAQAAVDSADLVLWLGAVDAAPAGDVIKVGAKADTRVDTSGTDISVSAVTGLGLQDLKTLLVKRCESLLPVETEVAINARHVVAMKEVLRHLIAASGPDLLIMAEELRLARAELDRLTGKAGVENMLDSLFSRFCIGK